MFVYILLIFLLSLLAITNRQRISKIDTIFIIIIAVLFIGLRYEMGTDWSIYMIRLKQWEDPDYMIEMFQRSFEISFNYLEFLSQRIVGDVVIANIICAIIFSFGLVQYCKKQPYPFLALLLAYPTLIVVVSFCNTRQSAAVGFELLALSSIAYQYRSFLYLILGSTFHQSLIFITLLPFTTRLKYIYKINNVLKILVVVLPFLYFFTKYYSYVIYGFFDFYIYNPSSLWWSSGAIFRLGWISVSAFIFLTNTSIFSKYEDYNQIFIYKILSILSILMFFIVIFNPSISTPLDRIGFYLYPLSIFVYVRCVKYRLFNFSKNMWKLLIISSCSIFHVYWLFNSPYQEFWLPYNNYLFL